MVLCALLVLTAASCGDEDSRVELLSSDRNEVEVGDEMEIRLSAEPGLGDAWQVAEPPDADVVRVVDQTSESDEPEIAGGLWEDVVILEAVGAGTATVVMHNCFRCDDKGNTPPEYGEEAVDVAFSIRVRER